MAMVQGFGGSNAHAILESYTLEDPPIEKGNKSETAAITPFLFSASKIALHQSLLAYKDYLTKHPDVNLSDLAWTLRAKRSAFSVKVAISASSAEELRNAISEKLEGVESGQVSTIGYRPPPGERRVLGIFTGQGAQWARYDPPPTFVGEKKKVARLVLLA